MVFYYILLANSATSSSYKIKTLRQQLTQATAQNSALLSQKSSIEDPNAAMQYALDQHMAEAKNVSYLFGNGSVALQK